MCACACECVCALQSHHGVHSSGRTKRVIAGGGGQTDLVVDRREDAAVGRHRDRANTDIEFRDLWKSQSQSVHVGAIGCSIS